MPQITLSVPREKLTLLQDFLSLVGIEGKKLQNSVSGNSMKLKIMGNTDSANSFYNKSFSWDSFRSELEFE